jgi:uncharacterized protein
MPIRIMITLGPVSIEGELSDTACARAIARILPFESRPDVWGDEFYFSVPVALPPDETATTRVHIGDIGYWPPGNAVAIFFGPTPLSTGADPVPASEVNIVGRITGDPGVLRKAKGESRIRMEELL